MALAVRKFFEFRPHLPFRFEVEFFTGLPMLTAQLKYAVQSVKISGTECDIGMAASYFGDGYTTIPIFNVASRTLTITFEETDQMKVLSMVDAIVDSQRNGSPWVLGVRVTEYDTRFRTIVSDRYYKCIMKDYDEPAFSRTGGPGIVTSSITLNIMSDQPWNTSNAEQHNVGKSQNVNLGTDELTNQLDIAMDATKPSQPLADQLGAYGEEFKKALENAKKNEGNGGGRAGSELKWKATKTDDGVTVLDITRSGKNKAGFNKEGGTVGAKKQELTVVIHKTGFVTGGKYSESGAAKGFNNEGVAAFAAGGSVIVSEDRMFDNHSAAGGTGTATNGFAIELGDKTRIGNAGAVAKIGNTYYARLDSGHGAQWIEMSQKDVDEFVAAVGVSDASKAFDKADASDNSIKNGKLTQKAAAWDGKQSKEVDFSKAEILVPKLTVEQQNNLNKIFTTVNKQAAAKGVDVSIKEVKHHGNLDGYKAEKLEGTKAQDQQVAAIANKALSTPQAPPATAVAQAPSQGNGGGRAGAQNRNS